MRNKSQLSKNEQILEFAGKSGIIRPRDLEALGVQREYLIRLYRKGLLNRIGRGLYTSSPANVSEHYSLAEACKKVPHAVVCLLSALRFHGLTTQAPFEVWIAIDNKSRRPKQTNFPLRVVRFSGDAFLKGIEVHSVEGVRIRVFDPAKTVADCFKYRNKIGLDAAIEALQECWRNRRCTMDQLWYYAKICRVTNVMRPYLESIT